MATLTTTRGLPGSGKSHATKDLPGWQCGRDELRRAFKGERWGYTAAEEKLLTQVQQFTIRTLLVSGEDVVVADTNLDPMQLQQLYNIAVDCDAEFAVRDYRGVSLGTCLDRNYRRLGTAAFVPAKKIIDMYQRWIDPGTDLPRTT